MEEVSKAGGGVQFSFLFKAELYQVALSRWVLKASKAGDNTSYMGNCTSFPYHLEEGEGSIKDDYLSAAQGSACCRVAAQAVPRAWLPPAALGTAQLN